VNGSPSVRHPPSQGTPPPRRRGALHPLALRIGLGILWCGAVLTLTLLPGSGKEAVPRGLCVLCGTFGLADFLRNVLLFTPLGLLVGRRLGVARTALLAAAFSGGIEVAQSVIPGRSPALGDVIANTTGGAMGGLLARRASWLRRLAAAPTAWERAALTTLAGALLALPALLHRPAYPEGRTYYFQWTADLGPRMEAYRGTLLEARVAGDPAPQGPVAETGSWLRPALEQGLDLELRLVAGPAPVRVAPLFSIYDDLEREVVLVGARGDDLVVRWRDVAERLRLDGVEPVWPGALRGLAPGDTFAVRVEQAERALCLRVAGRQRGGAAPGVEAGWAALMAPGFVPWLRTVVGGLWLAVVGGLLGVGRPQARRALFVGTAAALVGWVVAWLSPFLAPHLAPLLGLPVGAVVAGRLAGSPRGATARGGG